MLCTCLHGPRNRGRALGHGDFLIGTVPFLTLNDAIIYTCSHVISITFLQYTKTEKRTVRITFVNWRGGGVRA